MVKLSDALDVSLDYLLIIGENHVTGNIRDSKLIDQFVQVHTLPEKNRHILKALLKAFIKKHRFEELAMK